MGTKYNALGAKSPKVLKSDDSEASDFDEELDAKKVTLASKLDKDNDSIASYEANYDYAYINSATTTVVKSGEGKLKSVTVTVTDADIITIYDNTAGSGTVIAVLKAGIAEGTYTFDVAFTTGLTIVTAAAPKITVSYK